MPTYGAFPLAWREFLKLTPEMQEAWHRAIRAFTEDLRRGRPIRPGLRVKRVQAHPGVFELTFAPNGRATFEYGRTVRAGHIHIVWRRIGTHDIFRNP